MTSAMDRARFSGIAFCIVTICWAQGPSAARAADEQVAAFAFGSRPLDCATHSEPTARYTMVLQEDADSVEYSASRGWGYEVVRPGDTSRSGYGRFGPFDDSPNSRARFPDTCPSELYDSFIGAKNWALDCPSTPCPTPEGIVFRVDVPNGLYRFVAAVGSADNEHTHRLVVENGGSGEPANLSPDHVVLVHNFDQAVHGAGVFARVGFEGRIPPPGSGPAFVDMDEDGLETGGGPSSPVLEVTEGYVRVHQLRGTTEGSDPNGADLVILELWSVENTFEAVRRRSTWRYRPGDSEASSPDTLAWTTLGFEDSDWDAGSAPFGYGEGEHEEVATDLSLLDPPMRSNWSSLYLRQEFELARPEAVDRLVARVDYDDGFVAWINGREVLRVNVDGLENDPLSHDQLASGGHEAGLVEEFSLPEPVDYLTEGTNVVAVQVFNTSITSSDLVFDIEIFDPDAPDVTPPAESSTIPPRGARVRTLEQVRITFSEEVQGVDAGDLLVDSVPATSVTGTARGPYVFSFDPAGPGEVEIRWADDHGITDQADEPNPFPGGGWLVTVDPDMPLGSVVISEILTVNRSGLLDEDGEASDWFELRNDGEAPISLAGWSATDDAEEPDRWLFPDVVLGPQEHLVVFASGKDRSRPGGELHTSFRLSSTGEYLGIHDAETPRQVVSELAPRYPAQRPDLAWGLDGTGRRVYLESPTPGAPNATGVTFDGIAMIPRCFPGRGFYTDPIDVALSTGTPGARIRYTLDGSEPTPTSGSLYSGPVRVAPGGGKGAIALRAIAYADGLLSSEITTQTYVFPESVAEQANRPSGFPTSWSSQSADYEMDPDVTDDPGHRDLVLDGLTRIPTLSIVTDVDDLFHSSTGIYANPSREGLAWERPVSAELIWPDGSDGFQVDCGLRVQGGSSTSNWKVLKLSLRLLFKDDYGPTKLRHRLFPDTAIDEFDTIVLDAHLNQTWNHPSHGQRVRANYCRDQFVSDLQNATGGYAPHDIFAHLYLNGLYWGVYDLHERPDDSYASKYFGGPKDEYDCLRHSSGTVVAGNAQAWNQMLSVLRRDLTVPSNYDEVWNWLDVPGFVDYMIVNHYSGNDDWDHHNWYATRRRMDGAWYRIHSWDAEHVLKDVNINRLGVNNGGKPTEIFQRLRANPEFRLLFADHLQRHFSPGGILYVNPDRTSWDPDRPEDNEPASIYMRRIEEIDSYVTRATGADPDVGSAVSCESARWGDLRRSNDPYTRNDEWATELRWLLTQYFPRRSEIVLAQYRSASLYPSVGAPLLSSWGGRIEPGLELEISRPSGTGGTIWYTLDGSDPRIPDIGEVSPTARAYSEPLTIIDHTVLRARILSGATWSAMTETIYSLADPVEAVRVSEIMYHPADGDAAEFIELRNTGDATVGLSGAYFDEGIELLFGPGTSLAPGEHLVLTNDLVAFDAMYPGVEVAGVYSGSLSNGGEAVRLRTAMAETIEEVDYDDDGFWPISPDGLGYSLVRADEAGDPDAPTSWRASAEPGGSPGRADPSSPANDVLVSEVLARASAPLEGAIEIVNLSGTARSVEGWYLSDSRDGFEALMRYRIPDGATLAPGGRLVVYEADFGPGGGGPGSFRLDPTGGTVYLTATGPTGDPTGHVAAAAYGPDDDGVSFGRLSTSVGVDFAALEERTFGADYPATLEEFRTGSGLANADALVGPVVVNELMYHPDTGQEEFIELYNPTDTPVPLHDATVGRGWRIHGVLDFLGVDRFEFGPDDEIPARGYLLVVPIDAAVFRSLHAVPPSTPVVSAYGGGLDNSGEWIRLLRPARVGVDETVSWIVMDAVRYDDREPWPLDPDGSGASLERVVATAYGNDPASWAASERYGGTPGSENTASHSGENRPPEAIFTASPSAGEAPLDVLLDASASFDLDGEIVSYLWRFGDGETASDRVTAHTYVDAGAYTVELEVLDDEGARGTRTATILVESDEGGWQIPGDANQDGGVDISDGIRILQLLFLGGVVMPCESDGIDSPGNRTVLDVNADGGVNITDAVYLLGYLFQGGPPPAEGEECRRVVGCPDVCDS